MNDKSGIIQKFNIRFDIMVFRSFSLRIIPLCSANYELD